MALPNESTIFCSKCSGYNLPKECCICTPCRDKQISTLKDKIVENDIYTADEIFRIINDVFEVEDE